MKRSGWLRSRTPLRRKTRLKAKGRSRFEKRRDPKYVAWCKRHWYCAIQGRQGHRCWGVLKTFAHVFGTRGAGAYDLGEGVILCEAAHAEQEGRTDEFIAKYGVDVRALAVTMAARHLMEKEFV